MIDAIAVITDFPNTREFFVGIGMSCKSIARFAHPPTIPTGPGATGGGRHGWRGGRHRAGVTGWEGGQRKAGATRVGNSLAVGISQPIGEARDYQTDEDDHNCRRNCARPSLPSSSPPLTCRRLSRLSPHTSSRSHLASIAATPMGWHQL